MLITRIRGLIAPLITTHERPSRSSVAEASGRLERRDRKGEKLSFDYGSFRK